MNNYDKLLREKEQEVPLESNRKEMHWEAMAKLLGEKDLNTNKAPKPQGKVIRLFKAVVIIAAAFILIFWGYKQVVSTSSESKADYAGSKILPPLKAMDIPYEAFTINASQGDTLFTKNGSILIFPANSVMDASGSIITGNIEVKSREFNDVLDYSLAGIPMSYDSAGVKYSFVSSGMIDIRAYQNGNKLFINPNAKPQIHLASTNKEMSTNLYRLDTATGHWKNKGRDEVNVLAPRPKNQRAPIATNSKALADTGFGINNQVVYEYEESATKKPEPPHEATGKNPVIKIAIDPASFEELKVYDNMKFEVIGGDKWDPADSRIEWDNVNLVTIKQGQVYRVTFSKDDNQVSYLVNPALEGVDYTKALEVYNRKMKEYEEVRQKRLDKEAQQELAWKKESKRQKEAAARTNDSITRINESVQKENKRVEELNRLIELRNQEIEETNARLSAQMKRNKLAIDSIKAQAKRNKLIIVSSPVADSTNKAYYAALAAAEKDRKIQDSLFKLSKFGSSSQTVNNIIFRSFQIDGFGYWNCDQPTIPGGVMIVGSYKDDAMSPLNLRTINIAVYGINRLLTYNSTTINVVPNSKHVMWSFINGDLYYLTYSDYAALGITANTRSVEIRLRKYKGAAQTVAELKREIFM